MPNEGYTDDPTISDDAELWRRIHPDWVIFDEKRERWRLSSGSFTVEEACVKMALSFREEIKGRLDELGRSVYWLSKQVEGGHPSTVRAYLYDRRGRRQVRSGLIEEMLDILGMTVEVDD